MITPENLPVTSGLFTNYIFKSIPLAFDESLSYYETLCGILDLIKNKIIPAINNNAQAGKELQELYKQLKDYVDHYFDNLDVQNEINIKLDEMAENGELADVIAQYLESQAIIGFNNVSSLANATNLADGSFAKTYGKLTYNDGKGAFYKIRTRTNADVPDDDNIVVLVNTENLVAEKMRDYNIETINQEITKLNIPMAKLKNRKVLLIGDSYGEGYTPDGNVTSWEHYFVSYTGLNNTIKKYEGGAGFCHLSSHNKTFLSVLNEVPDDENVTDIIVCGGWNDRAFTSNDILSAMLTFKTRALEKFPNADIYVGMIGCSSNSNEILGTNTLLWRYRVDTPKAGMRYLNNVEYSLHEYFLNFSSDGVHPNDYGQQKLAQNIVTAWLQGSCNVQYDYSSITFTPATGVTLEGFTSFGESFINNVVEISNSSSLGSINFASGSRPSIISRSQKIEIADITKGYIIGTDYQLCQIPSRALILCDAGYVNANVNFVIQNKKLYVVIENNGNSAGNNYQNFSNIQQIQFSGFQAMFNSCLC